jgi:ketosteroid isomerase-like protein
MYSGAFHRKRHYWGPPVQGHAWMPKPNPQSHAVAHCFESKELTMTTAKWAAALLASGSVAFSQGDPVAVQQHLFDALSRGDVPAALELFTEDAVIDSESGVCTRTHCAGKAAIRQDLERFVADKTRRITVLSTVVSGNLLVTRFEARGATVEQAGVDRVILWGIREMRGDKIASYRCCMPERTDTQTAQFLDAITRGSASTALPPPLLPSLSNQG